MPTPARVLVVDDSPTILRVVRSILTRHGYEAETARDGAAGIEMIRQGPKFDLVLLDFVMPRMNGYQFCRELRASPEHRELPVVLMSAKADRIGGHFVQEMGAVFALAKPFDPRTLLATVEGALARAASNDGGIARAAPYGASGMASAPSRDERKPSGAVPRDESRGAHAAHAEGGLGRSAARDERAPREVAAFAVATPRGPAQAPVAAPPPDDDAEELDVAVDEDPSLAPATVPDAELRERAIAEQVASVVAPALARLGPDERATEADVRVAIARVLTPAILRALGLGGAPDPARDALLARREVMSGDLRAIPLAEVLQVLHLQRQTGVLRVAGSEGAVAVAVRSGLVDHVRAQGPPRELLLGRYFVERGLVSRAQIERLVAARTPGDPPLGEALVRAGLATAADVASALVRQSSELLYEVLRWPSGRFAFTLEPFWPEAESARLGLDVPALLMEGFRRVDERRVIEASLRPTHVLVPRPDAGARLRTTKLGSAEQAVLGLIDGTRTVADLLEEGELASFDALKAIHDLVTRKLVTIRDP